MACDTDKIWHRSGTAHAVAPVDSARGLRFSCSSTLGGTTAPRGLNVAAPVQITR